MCVYEINKFPQIFVTISGCVLYMMLKYFKTKISLIKSRKIDPEYQYFRHIKYFCSDRFIMAFALYRTSLFKSLSVVQEITCLFKVQFIHDMKAFSQIFSPNFVGESNTCVRLIHTQIRYKGPYVSCHLI